MEKDKHLGLRIDSDTHKKLKSLAEYEGRSINGEILYLIRQAITRHEKKHGSLL
ncbi:MAG: Arc family DNA-binding protein [Lachnospiraceae bacterium]|nr:Arc family DNA-binding protein [Lachnospiraceae bacterium]RKJ49050.1 Arc family DNA-binding protein [bacterium 1XD42-54]